MIPNFSFESPNKTLTKNQFKPQSANSFDDSNEKQNLNSHSIQESSILTSIFKKKAYTKIIKKASLRILAKQEQNLQNFKLCNQLASEQLNQSFKSELNKTYVIVARITKIIQDRKSYVLHCQDDSFHETKVYFPKQTSNVNQGKFLINKSRNLPQKIKNIDELDFECSYIEGTPYFKLFVVFRSYPIYSNSQNESSNQNIPENQSVSESSYKKTVLPKIKQMKLRLYLEHFSKISDFNYLAWHNMQVCLEELVQKRQKLKNGNKSF